MSVYRMGQLDTNCEIVSGIDAHTVDMAVREGKFSTVVLTVYSAGALVHVNYTIMSCHGTSRKYMPTRDAPEAAGTTITCFTFRGLIDNKVAILSYEPGTHTTGVTYTLCMS